MTSVEREVRVNLAACYRLVARYGLLEWPALLRALDRSDPSYRD